jgi:hypothetical protein
VQALVGTAVQGKHAHLLNRVAPCSRARRREDRQKEISGMADETRGHDWRSGL